jgi:hypothetical protein
MKSIQALANKAYTSILGALGSGASGTPSNNEVSQLNAAPIAAGATVSWVASALVTRTGKVLVSVNMTASKNGGTLAAGDVVTFQMTRNGAPIGAQARVTATTAGGDVVATAALTWVDALAVPGTSYAYGIIATPSAHTCGLLVGEAAATAIDI